MVSVLTSASEWDLYWRTPDPDRKDSKWSLYTRLALMVADQVERQGALVLADVGCGPGAFLDRMRGIGKANAIGFDISEVAVDSCKMRGHSAFAADATDLPIDGSLGVIACIDTLDCLLDQAAALSHWASLLNDDGVLILVLREGTIDGQAMRKMLNDAGLTKIEASSSAAGGQNYKIYKAGK